MVVAKDVVTGRKSQQLFSSLQGSLATGKYKPGQQFHSITELCRMYNVSSATVIKCLGQLENEGVLTRRQGSGTYVRKIPAADAPAHREASDKAELVPCIDFIVPDNIGPRSGLRYLNELVSVVCNEMNRDNLSVRVGLLPGRLTERKELEDWLDHRRMSGARAFIFRWVPRLVQEITVEKGWLACINGRPDAGITLPFVDNDQEQIGQIVGKHLSELGCQRVGVLMRAEWRPGDNVMFNSLLGSLGGRLVAIETAVQTVPEIDAACRKLLSTKPSIDAVVIRSDDPGTWLLNYINGITDGINHHVRIIEAMDSKPWHPLIDTLAPDGPGPAVAYRECLEMLFSGKRITSTGKLVKMKIVPGIGIRYEQRQEASQS